MIPKRNPFVFGPVVRDENFCGRRKEILDIRRTVEAGMHIVLYSRRRTGKTSLINRLFEEMRHTKRCVYLDLSRVTSQREFFEDYAEQVLKKSGTTYSSIRKLTDKLGKILGHIDIKISAGPDGAFSLGLDPASLPAERIPDLLSLPERLGGKFVIAMDEYQNIVNLPGSYEMESFMRSIIQNFRNTSVIFAGSRAHMMRNIFSNPQRPHYRLARAMSLGPLTEEEAIPFMGNKFSPDGYGMDESMLKEIFKTVEGDPYYLQALCFHCWNLLPSEHRFGQDDLRKAEGNMMINEAMYFEALWRYLAPGQKKVLKVIAEGENPYGKKWIAKSSTAQALKALSEKDLVEIPEKGIYRLTDPFLGKWVVNSLSGRIGTGASEEQP